MVIGSLALADALQGRYTIERELGRGGMATVYLARDLKHERPVALKVLHQDLAAFLGPERFQREIRIAAALQHPNILPVFDSGHAPELLWYTMPYVEGESLRGRLVRDGRLPVPEALRLAREVGLALDYAHRRGVVHRDVKPENILLSDDHALLMDFGIAQSAQPLGDPKLTTRGLVLGTPAYISPEQALGDREVDGRSDIYALAAVLFEMLVGSPPYTGSTLQAIIGQCCAGPVPSVRARRGSVPDHVDRALRCALAPDPTARFPTAASFAAALEASAGGSADLTLARPIASALTARGAQVAESVPSIAVLPFANMSMDPANEYFSDGITEELLDALAHVPSLKVTGRRSSFAFKGKAVDLQTIAEQLRVQALVEGSVRKVGDRVRITAQLVSAEDGHTLWSDHYDRELKDVFELQEAIAGAIVAAVSPHLVRSSPPRPVQKPRVDPEAYELLLKGRSFLHRMPEGLGQAVSCYERAVGRDPAFARAHVGLAGAYLMGGMYSLLRARDAFPRARLSAMRALELDETLARPHDTLGVISHAYDWDWEAARQHFQRSAELRGGDVRGWGPTFLLASIGRFEEALTLSHLSIEHDPLALDSHTYHSLMLLVARRFTDIVQHCKLIAELNPNHSETYRLLGYAYEMLGQFDQALDACERAVALSHRHPWALSALARTLARLGRHDEVDAHVAALAPGVATGSVLPIMVAHIQAVANRDRAFEWLERGVQERDFWLAFLRVDPLVDGVRDDPRFERLARRIGIPPLAT